MIGHAFSGADADEGAETPPVEPFSAEEGFDAEFQTRVAAFSVRDDDFLRRVRHLLKPDYFENAGEAILVSLALSHFDKYRCAPDKAALVVLIREASAKKVIRPDMSKPVVESLHRILTESLQNRLFLEERVVAFVRHQAVSQAILQSVDLIEKKEFGKIENAIKAAISVGAAEEGDAYDYFERIDERTERRMEAASGKLPPQGVTTGVPKLDALLYHRGWGRKELTSIMGGAKAGKTTGLINFAKAASIAGHNVFYATLEVGANIISDRLDACLTSTAMKELCDKIHAVDERIKEIGARAGALKIHEFASGTLTPNMLRKTLERYKSPGYNRDGSVRPPIKFDLIVVDYADIMAPNNRTNDPIENSKSVYVDLRAIAFEENAAVLTATQTNRAGFTAAVAKAEHVAEDFNKVRTVDLMISINKTDEEARVGEARLYFAASRNQESGFTVVVKQNIAAMQFIEGVLRVE